MTRILKALSMWNLNKANMFYHKCCENIQAKQKGYKIKVFVHHLQKGWNKCHCNHWEPDLNALEFERLVSPNKR